jgi:methylthioribose-1-phosphate isomerase
MKNLNKLKKNLPATVELKGDKVFMIDQVFLPDKLKIVELKNYSQAIAAIKEFNVRGAQAIGAVGGAGLFLASKSYKGNNFKDYLKFLKKVGKELIKARPTASNLFWAINLLLDKIDSTEIEKAKKSIFDNYKKILKEEVNNNLKIGSHGSKLIKSGDKIMTHCNAGSLSSIWYGTATAPIYSAFLKKKKISVLVNETRPWLQGSRLTAWEMKQAKIDYKINIDSAIGFLMANKMVDIVIVGADRIALNGDVANKIGTYPLALMAKEHNVPFYVAAVKATIDFESKKGGDIEIEERSEDEILKHTSYWEDKNLKKKKNNKKFDSKLNISPKGARAFNPVFDITPAKLITGIITEHGISKPNEIKKLKNKK